MVMTYLPIPSSMTGWHRQLLHLSHWFKKIFSFAMCQAWCCQELSGVPSQYSLHQENFIWTTCKTTLNYQPIVTGPCLSSLVWMTSTLCIYRMHPSNDRRCKHWMWQLVTWFNSLTCVCIPVVPIIQTGRQFECLGILLAILIIFRSIRCANIPVQLIWYCRWWGCDWSWLQRSNSTFECWERKNWREEKEATH